MTQTTSSEITTTLELLPRPVALGGSGGEGDGNEVGFCVRRASNHLDGFDNDKPKRHDDWLEFFRYFDEEKQAYEYTEGCLMHHQSPFRKYWDAITMVPQPSSTAAL